ncbi:hypothetical protein [uncultured Roseibium sp.]|uniref:hypothetical protein n=1 Tax=uncultured Roseibium sp. TaxID=1936171 RepID=UPI002614C0D3|nr:hypothetical protein [uncultured Roseibium sp.]
MNVILLIAGILVLAVTAADFAFTTISANKAGPLTRGAAAVYWYVFRLLARLPGESAALRLAGPVVMSGVALVWLALTFVGWLLIFRSYPEALVMKSTGEPADWASTFAFIGSALSTVGASNVQPSSALWDNLSTVAAVSGMVVLTLSVTFVLNITQTVVQGRGFTVLLRIRDPLNVRNDDILLPALADLCIRLNASPLALYYSSSRWERGLPESLNWLARRVAQSPERFRSYRYALQELPFLSVDGDDDPEGFLEAMQDWARQFSLHDWPAEQ